MLAKFPKQLITKEIFDTIEQQYLTSLIYYIIDSKYRTSVQLSSWLKGQVSIQSSEVDKWVNAISTLEDSDGQMVEILRYVRNVLIYKSDKEVWDMLEKWQEGEVSAQKRTGDCEDGAILTYIIARRKGIPANRLLLMCGDVNGGGHCWLAYKPNCYPLDFVFLDWCYFSDVNSIEQRDKFHIEDNSIQEYIDEDTVITSNYYNIWFAFNELHSYKMIRYEYK
jgi:predicted transglutaminase-like cysteine proteinase